MGTIPALLSLLSKDLCNYEQVSEDCPWATTQDIAASLLKRKIVSKLADTSNEETRRVAIEAFLHKNEECKSYALQLDSCLDELLIGNLRNVLYQFFMRADKTIFEVPIDSIPFGVGPGASFGADGNDVYTKLFDGPIAASGRHLCRAYDRYVTKNDSWFAAEYSRTCAHGNPLVRRGSKLDTVPKNDSTDRTICVEPAINMGFQLAMGRIIEARLSSFFGIEISSRSGSYDDSAQPVLNRLLAERYSCDNGGATIDCKSASDSIAIKMLREVLPSPVLDLLLFVRSPRVFEGWGEPVTKVHLLHMISTMGNGYTFPLQTALFAAVVSASYLTVGEYWCKSSQTSGWSVFGDDIIVPKHVLRFTLRLLALLGFEVNADKTYVDGPFRESCGVDVFKGINVRPVYIKRLKSKQDFFVAINRLVEWSIRHDIPLRHTIRYLRKKAGGLCFVPPWESYDSGIKVPEPSKRRDDNKSFLYDAWVPKSRKLRIHLLDVADGPRGWNSKTRSPYNSAGLFLSFLYGSLRSSQGRDDLNCYSIGVKSRRTQYRSVLRIAPNWGFVSPAQDTLSPLERRRWEAMFSGVYGDILNFKTNGAL